ncbi:hypothetical protein BDP27DRAFT_1316213 [Rhodocollybia butyracea]|uniref:Uncharacterized protein n=1 Tax=Rhodocollybia butyracea TaxID=206335 RepID=A0A9P5Q4K3_9AGAR|nr:hypothetical protein BDP27DRAFT_1316213 [Rhodocollybia butyracea]
MVEWLKFCCHWHIKDSISPDKSPPAAWRCEWKRLMRYILTVESNYTSCPSSYPRPQACMQAAEDLRAFLETHQYNIIFNCRSSAVRMAEHRN